MMVKPCKSRTRTFFAFLSNAALAAARAFSLLSKGLPSLQYVNFYTIKPEKQ
jgi:hypothetical protein